MIETLGIIFSSFDIRDYKATTSLKTFSDEFELKIPRVKSQGNVSSCGAHVLSCIVEYFNYKQHGITTEMSVGYIYGNRKESTHKSKGMILREALNTLRLYGDVAKVDFPYNTEIPDISNKYNKQANELYEIGYPSRISAYYRVKTIPEFKAALRLGYPIAIGVKWYSDMKVVNGVLTSKYKGYRGGHCMLLYGWNEKGWKVQNSWGKSWGNKGTCIIPYDMPIHEAWAVVDNIKDEVKIKKPLSSSTGKQVAKVINTIGNNINRISSSTSETKIKSFVKNVDSKINIAINKTIKNIK